MVVREFALCSSPKRTVVSVPVPLEHFAVLLCEDYRHYGFFHAYASF